MGHRGRVLVVLAVRNLRRQARRSLLTALAMIVGVGLLVMSRALADGAHEDWIDSGVRMGSGHVTVQGRDYRLRRTLEHRLDPEALRSTLEEVGRLEHTGVVVGHTVRLEAEGLASTAAGAVPVSVVGVDRDLESRFSRLDLRLAEGAYLPPDDRLAACVGASLARRLELRIGSRLVLTAQDANGDIVGQLVRVRGIVRTGIEEVDTHVIQMPLETAREWLSAPGAATSVALVLPTSRDVDFTVERLRAALAPVPELEVVGWRESMPELEAAVRVDDFGDYVFHAITLIIVALAVVNTILMSVLYRTREFGIVRALGMSRTDTGLQVLIEGTLLSLVSGIAGIGVGVAVTWLFFRHGLDFSAFMGQGFETAGVIIEPVIHPRLRLGQALASLGFVFVIGVAASIYPAFRATRIEVAEAVQFEA